MNTKCRLAIEKYNMLSYGDSVVVGLSGGADSCSMLHYLCSIREEFGLNIIAVHLNHMIRGQEAERDAAFARQFCRTLNVDFRLYELDVPKIAAERGIGIEECGREMRYEIFGSESEKFGGKIATAHTLSDSVETIIFHIIRGCSLNGLRGIPPVRGNIIRPLILCEREEIESYCHKNNIRYVTDSTNLSSDYTRNKIRLQILPLMREINPSVTHALGRLSEIAAGDDDYLNSLAHEIAREYFEFGREEGIFAAPEPLASRVLMEICCKKFGVVPEHRHISAIIECLKCGAGKVNLSNNNVFCIKNRHILLLTNDCLKQNQCQPSNWYCELSDGEIITPFSQKILWQLVDKNKYDNIRKIYKNVFQNSLDYDKIGRAVFRFRHKGDSFRQAGRGNTKSLKKLFNERKIPTDLRYRIPMLECDGRVAWICSVGVAEGFQVSEDTKNILYIQIEPQIPVGTGTGADIL